jgi:hypothetical protein
MTERRHAVAKLRKVESRAERTLFFFYAETEYLRYRGKDIPCDLQMCVFDMGSWVLELHQVDDTPSTFREFVNKHGQGVHHLGFEVGADRDKVISQLKEMGFTERTIGVYPGSSWTIVDTEDVLGVNLNIKPKR